MGSYHPAVDEAPAAGPRGSDLMLMALLLAGGVAAAVLPALLKGGGLSGCPAGTVDVQLLVAGGPGQCCATNGACTDSATTLCYATGATAEFSAVPYRAGPQSSSFLRFEGPGGVTSTQNPFRVKIGDTPGGFVRAVFSGVS